MMMMMIPDDGWHQQGQVGSQTLNDDDEVQRAMQAGQMSPECLWLITNIPVFINAQISVFERL